MKTPRVVLDTNILLSALLFHTGSLAWLRIAWRSKIILPLASRDTASELIRVLSYPKFRLSVVEREDLLGDYLPWCEVVKVPRHVEIPDCRDSFDCSFLALAAFTKADALVSGDKDLLVLADRFSVPILTPAAFREKLG
jgi:putative PIN family toxin of toxin-antitoxin system